MKTTPKLSAFMYFWLNYCDENHHIERIPVAVKDIDHLFQCHRQLFYGVEGGRVLIKNVDHHG